MNPCELKPCEAGIPVTTPLRVEDVGDVGDEPDGEDLDGIALLHELNVQVNFQFTPVEIDLKTCVLIIF